MRVLEEFICPYCGSLVEDGDYIYLRGDEVIGCEICIEHEPVDIPTEEQLQEDAEQEYIEGLWEADRIERLMNETL